MKALPLINADERGFLHSELTDGIIRVFYDTYNELGYGFLEAIYKRAMCMALRVQGFSAKNQVSIPVWFHGEQIGD